MAKLSFLAGFLMVIILFASVIVPSSFTVTWQEDEYRLTTELVADEFPAITQTSDGRIWIVWAKAVLGDRTLYYKTSQNLGLTWSDEKNLTYIPETIIGTHDTAPSIIQAANGTIWLTYHSNKPPPLPDFIIDASPKTLTVPQGGSNSSTISIYSLLSFGEPVTLTTKQLIPFISTTFDPNPVTPPPNDIATSTLTVTADATANLGSHTLTVLGKTENKSHILNISLEITESGTTALSEPASSTSTSTSSSAEDETDYEIYYKTSNDNGATWSNRIPLTNNAVDDLRPSIIQLMNGTIMVVWQSDRTGNPEIFYKTSNGTLWSDAIQLTANITFDQGPSIMQAEDEKIWVAWTSDRTGNSEIFCKTYNGTTGSWSNATQLTDNTNSDSNPSLLQTIDETLWLFWQSSGTSPNAHADIYYKNSTDNGANWSDRVQFTTDNNEDLWPATTQTRGGRIWVAWTSNRANQPDGNWDIWYKYSDEIVIHDVAITHVEPATSTAKLGDSIAIAVVAVNQGSKEESFEVSCYANSILIDSKPVDSLDVGESRDIYITWNTTGFAAGVYVIKATASGVEGEVDLEDNTFTDGTVELMEPVHDVAVINVTRDSNVVLQGNTVSINVTAQNQGTETETLNVSCYVNSTSIDFPQTKTLVPANSTLLLNFTWDTSGFAIGKYVVSATADIVPDEDDTNDNTFIDGTIELTAQPVHDIAAIGVTPSLTTVSIGQHVSIEVTVRNEGTETETFSITAKYDDTEIGTAQTVTSLPAGEVTTRNFTWDTTDVLSGNYTISAEASLIPGETDTADNTFIDGDVTVLPYRDVAITNVTASPAEVTKPEPVNINVTVLNEGELSETFNVTTYYEGIEIDFTQTDIILEAGANTTLTFIWDTTTADEDTYTISAKVSTVPYETDIADNTFIDGEVTVTRPPGAPVASFTWSPLEPLVNEIITFNASASYDPDGGNETYPSGIVSYEWDFGDGITGIGMIANHTYTTTGRYRVTLTVEDVDVETDSVMRIVTVYRCDVAIVDVTAYPTKAVVGDLVSINVTALNKGGLTETFDVTVYYDTTKIETQTVNNLLPGVNTTLTFTWNTTGLATGEYVLKAEASTVPGETYITDNSFTNGQVTLGMFPSAIFTYSPSTPVVGETITFNATGSKPNGGIISRYMWDFGDDLTGWGIILEHSYASLRTYEVKLTVTDSEGLTDSTTRNVTVHVAPVASFTYTPSVPKVGEVVTFNASASYSPEESAIVGFAWNFGDGVNGTGMIKTYTYTDSGTFVVTLTVKDVVGNEDTDSMTITVAEAPLPFSPWTLEVLGVVIAIVAIGLVLTVLFFRKRTADTKS